MELPAGYAPLQGLARRVIAFDDLVPDGLEALAAGRASEKIIVAVA